MIKGLFAYPVKALKDRIIQSNDRNLLDTIVGSQCRKVALCPFEGLRCQKLFCQAGLNKFNEGRKDHIATPEKNVKQSQNNASTFLTEKQSPCPNKCEMTKLANAKSKSDKVMKKIMMRCRNYDSGCTKYIPLFELFQHESKGAYSLVKCNNCEEFIIFNKITQHQKKGKEMMKEKFVCKHCKKIFDLSYFNKHDEDCENKEINCKGHPKGRYKAPRNTGADHEKSCTYLLKSCPTCEYIFPSKVNDKGQTIPCEVKENHDCFIILQENLSKQRQILDEYNFKLDQREDEVDYYKRELMKLQSISQSKRSVLQDLKNGYEYTLDTYQSKENKKIGTDIDNIIKMVGRAKDREEEKQKNKREQKADFVESQSQEMHGKNIISVDINKTDPINVVTNKLIHGEDKVTNPSIHKLKTYIDSESHKPICKNSVTKDTCTSDSFNDSTYCTPAKHK